MTHPEIAEADLAWLARLARALVREPHAADDLVQDTVLAAARSPASRERPRAFLATIARRLSTRRARAEARRTRRERLAARDERLPDPTELVARAEVVEQVLRAVRALEEPFRTTVRAHFLDGIPIREIARREGRPEDTVRWRLRQGIGRLRRQLAQGCGPGGSAWSVLLLPLARADGANRGPTAAAGAMGVTGPAALLASMKLQSALAFSAAVLLCAAGLYAGSMVLGGRSAAPGREDPRPVASRAETTGDGRVATDRRMAASVPADRPRRRRAPPPAPAGARARILVVDPSRRPVVGAEVEMVAVAVDESPSADRGTDRTLRTDGDGIADLGRPWPAEDGGLGLVVRADGWLRAVVPPPLTPPANASAPLVVVLRPGVTLRGRVVDAAGDPVPGLDLLAHTAGHGVEHVSASSVALRAARRDRDPRRPRYQQSRGRTASDGSVAFAAVPATAELVVRSEDPGWRILGPGRVPGDAPFVTWRAARTLGVVVRALDANTRAPVSAAATFRVDLDLADGTRRDVGQWVGRGRDDLRFAFHDELYPPLAGLDVVRATFHGTVTTGSGRTTAWRADPILSPRDGGVAEVEVLVAVAAAEAGRPLPGLPTMPLLLDVVDGAGRPFTGPLDVGWSSETRVASRRDEAPARRVAPGTYRVEVPVPGDVDALEILVEPDGASGSLQPWTASVSARPDVQQTLAVRLRPAGEVVILRPRGWTGPWQVHASFRGADDAGFRGSWTYGTEDDRLTLRALSPATWRFELTQDGRARVLEVPVGPGERAVVGG